MRTRLAVVGAGVAIALGLAACGSSGQGSAGSGTTAPRSPASTSTTAPATSAPTAATSSALSSALVTASTTENVALATYQNVMATLGNVAPFANVAAAEQQHVAAVKTVAAAHGVTLPTGPFNAPASPSTLTAACQLGVTTEENVVHVYDTLIPQVSAYPDVARVFTTIKTAAEDNHLPAFEHCA